jgi:excisionase family DNA binding protein
MPRPKKKYQNPVIVFPAPQSQQSQHDITPRYLNIYQAAQYCGITTWSVRRLISSGELKAAKMGRRLTVDRFQIDELWQKRSVAA